MSDRSRTNPDAGPGGVGWPGPRDWSIAAGWPPVAWEVTWVAQQQSWQVRRDGRVTAGGATGPLLPAIVDVQHHLLARASHLPEHVIDDMVEIWDGRVPPGALLAADTPEIDSTRRSVAWTSVTAAAVLRWEVQLEADDEPGGPVWQVRISDPHANTTVLQGLSTAEVGACVADHCDRWIPVTVRRALDQCVGGMDPPTHPSTATVLIAARVPTAPEAAVAGIAGTPQSIAPR